MWSKIWPNDTLNKCKFATNNFIPSEEKYLRTKFPLFCSHLDLAHSYWKELLSSDSIVIDATCGQGYDSEVLKNLPHQELHLIDIQKEALDATKEKIGTSGSLFYHHMCHSALDTVAQAESVTLIVYNLGYLPGHDKTIKTLPETTLESIKKALSLLKMGGVISITCYPGHHEGKIEEDALIVFSKTLSPKTWNVCFHRFVNRNCSPSLLLLQKRCS